MRHVEIEDVLKKRFEITTVNAIDIAWVMKSWAPKNHGPLNKQFSLFCGGEKLKPKEGNNLSKVTQLVHSTKSESHSVVSDSL